jgi:hypothetical protein
VCARGCGSGAEGATDVLRSGGRVHVATPSRGKGWTSVTPKEGRSRRGGCESNAEVRTRRRPSPASTISFLVSVVGGRYGWREGSREQPTLLRREVKSVRGCEGARRDARTSAAKEKLRTSTYLFVKKKDVRAWRRFALTVESGIRGKDSHKAGVLGDCWGRWLPPYRRTVSQRLIGKKKRPFVSSGEQQWGRGGSRRKRYRSQRRKGARVGKRRTDGWGESRLDAPGGLRGMMVGHRSLRSGPRLRKGRELQKAEDSEALLR